MRRRAKPGKAKVKAKPSVARKSPKNETSGRHELEERLAESLEREKATSEILRVISSSPSDIQPVFDAIAANAARLCDAVNGMVIRFDGQLLHLAAHHNVDPERLAAVRQAYPRPPSRGALSGRAILTRAVVHVPDVSKDPEYTLPAGTTVGYRSVLAVPMMHEGVARGTILVARDVVAPFSDTHIALIQTFADQAVIAIENVRLFTELHASNHHLTEALDQQTATAEILKVISSTPTDAQPVFDTIVRNAGRVCDSVDAVLSLRLDNELTVAAHWGPIGVQLGRRAPLAEGSVAGQTILTARPIHVADLSTASEFPKGRELALRWGHRTTLGVPLLREGEALGTLQIRRTEVRPFSDAQIAMLQTFADQAVIAIENVRLFTELQASNRELTTALDQQTATSDILRVISRSQTDVQPVFDAIVASAVRLLGAYTGVLTRVAGDQIELAALTRTGAAGDASLQTLFPQPLDFEGPHAYAIRDRAPLNIADAHTDPRVPEVGRATARARGYRSQVMVPLLRHDEAVGTIGVSRREPGGFTDDEIALLKTFADQAVIAIENVRLFTELEGRNRDLTATSEILRVISSSPTDAQPVFRAIAESAAHLTGGVLASVYEFDGSLIHLRVLAPADWPHGDELRQNFPRPPAPDFAAGRVILERAVLHGADLWNDPDTPELTRAWARRMDLRSVLWVPMFREGEPIGVIGVTRRESGFFPDEQVRLLQTFADQAVIAIENVRLFTELQASNRELTTALDQQTATSDILRVISRSQTDVQPVFQAIIDSAARLLRAHSGTLTRLQGDQIVLAAFTSTDDAGDAAVRATYPQLLQSEGNQARAIRDRAPINIADAQTDPRSTEAQRATARARGRRSVVAVPMLRHHEAVGTIAVSRREPGGFTDDEIALLQTFADQAVIAIENVRLFNELQARTGELTRSVEQLTALGEVSQALSSTLDVETVLDTIVLRATQLAGADGCAISEYDDATEVFHVRATHGVDAALVGTLRAMPLRKGEGVMGRAAETREPIQVADIAVPGAYESHVRDVLIRAGFLAILSVPLLREEQIIGSLSLLRKARGEFSPEVIEVLKTFATQSALAIQNARLFREIADKSAQLEAASHHKSEFLANMSHELRTPLNAIIGFSEVLTERMFGELNEKQDEYLKDINASGQHLLSLINDILDLSKIEAGRMELELADFDLPSAIDNALPLVRERATRRGIALGRTIDEHLGMLRGDERKVKQVLLNLLSNALKFTPEGGRIDVSARLQDGAAEIAVADTGVGIAPEDQEAVFEEFRQVGTADKKVEGTGLGLALSRKFIELHGGRIWVKSQVGVGSTFTFTLPVRRED